MPTTHASRDHRSSPARWLLYALMALVLVLLVAGLVDGTMLRLW